MKSAFLCLIFIVTFAPFVVADTAQTEEAKQNADLKQLLTEVRKILPKGWRAEITPDVPEDLIIYDDYRYDTVHLLIWHEEKVLGRWSVINDWPKTDEERELDYKLETPKFDLAVVPYLPLEAYGKAADENIRRQLQRMDFAKKNLRTIHGWDQAGPVAPLFYKPGTDAEKELLRQYTLLWSRTKLERLPTYFYRSLSFDTYFGLYRSDLELKDERLDTEQNKIRDAVLKIITQYPGKQVPESR